MRWTGYQHPKTPYYETHTISASEKYGGAIMHPERMESPECKEKNLRWVKDWASHGSPNYNPFGIGEPLRIRHKVRTHRSLFPTIEGFEGE